MTRAPVLQAALALLVPVDNRWVVPVAQMQTAM